VTEIFFQVKFEPSTGERSRILKTRPSQGYLCRFTLTSLIFSRLLQTSSWRKLFELLILNSNSRFKKKRKKVLESGNFQKCELFCSVFFTNGGLSHVSNGDVIGFSFDSENRKKRGMKMSISFFDIGRLKSF
jgi:hypothetical protein